LRVDDPETLRELLVYVEAPAAQVAAGAPLPRSLVEVVEVDVHEARLAVALAVARLRFLD
jgi:hypothetical protein